MKKMILFPILLIILAGTSELSALPEHLYSWPVRDPYSIVDTISTLQFYGPTPGFHHGVDIHAAAGTAVYAPVGGSVGMGYYYPPAQVPYTYEVFIDGDDGYRWEFHHIDQQTIPKEIAELASNHGRVEAGALLARIYDAPQFDPRILPHVHVDVIAKDGVYQNGLKFFPRISDHTAPVVQGVYLVDPQNKVVAARAPDLDLKSPIASGKYELVLDISDVIDGAPMGDSLSKLKVSANGAWIGSFDFSEQLPLKNYLQGVTDIYKIQPIALPNGKTITNQVEQSEPRKFLYRVALDTTKFADSVKTVSIRFQGEDFAGNPVQGTFEIEITR